MRIPRSESFLLLEFPNTAFSIAWDKNLLWKISLCYGEGVAGDGVGVGAGGDGVEQHMGRSPPLGAALVGWQPTGERTDNNLNRYQPGAQHTPRPRVGRLEAGEAFLTNGRAGERGEPGAGRPAS